MLLNEPEHRHSVGIIIVLRRVIKKAKKPICFISDAIVQHSKSE